MTESRSPKPTKERFTTYLPPQIAEWITRGADREARSESQQIAYQLQKQYRREQAETPEATKQTGERVPHESPRT